MQSEITVLRSGLAAVTDLGRFAAHYGQSLNGALDQYSAKVANTLSGNDANAPLIEMTLADFRFTADKDILIAVTGAPATMLVNGQPRPQWEPTPVAAGDILDIRHGSEGLRSYLAVHGTLQVPRLLGSCSPDTLIGYGTHLIQGSRLVLEADSVPSGLHLFGAPLFRPGMPVPAFGGTPTIDVTLGPDIAEFEATIHLLFGKAFEVGARSNHIGLRLRGKVPSRESRSELLSSGVPLGAVEVPSQEEVLVLHRGRGVTAGYPVPAVVTALGLDVLAQVRPGQSIRFRKIDTREALERYREQQRMMHHLRHRMTFILDGLGVTAAWNKPHVQPFYHASAAPGGSPVRAH